MTLLERRAHRQHADGLGRVLTVHADKPGWPTNLIMLILWVAFSALTFINPGETLALAIAPTVSFAIIFLLMHHALSGERLFICERGLLVGNVSQFSRPTPIPYRSIVRGTLSPIDDVPGFIKAEGDLLGPSIRRHWWTKKGIAFDAPPKRVFGAKDGDESHYARVLWLAGVGSADPHRVIAEITTAWDRLP